MKKTPITSIPSKKKAKQYKIKNWSQYNRALINRGNITLWFSSNLKLIHKNTPDPRKRGGQKRYEDRYIELCCVLRKIFGLPFRQTEGMMQGIIQMLKLSIAVPCYTQICRRMKQLKIDTSLRERVERGESIHIVMDSTGLKVYGEGEWKVRQHGRSKRRTWRKLHIGIDSATGEILCHLLTDNSMNDADMVKPLLNQLPKDLCLHAFIGDGIYDKQKVYEILQEREIEAVIPPRKDAKIICHGNRKGKGHPRDENLRYIRKYGRRRWKEEHGYYQRNKVETTMFRIKRIFSERLQSRTIERQEVEVALMCKIVNKMSSYGMPLIEKVDGKVA